MAKFKVKDNYIAVSADFIENHMPSANAAFVKVYLYALMSASRGGEAGMDEIAKKLGLIESDVIQAFAYWEKEGLISVDNGTVEFLTGAAREKSVQAKPVSAQKKYDPATVAKAINGDKMLSEMFMVAQSLLGKTLNEQDMATLYSFHEWLGFQPEIILMLLDHCISMGKSNMKYIEKVAISWHEAGLFTAQAVTDYLKTQQERGRYVSAVKKLLGIDGRNLTAMEEKYIRSWDENYQMSPEMVSLAFEYCVMQTSKLSMPYMDKIMSRWKEFGIFTPEAAQADNEQFRAKNASKKSETAKPLESYGQNPYDYDEIERRMWEKIKKG